MDKSNKDQDDKGKELVDLSQLPKTKGWAKPHSTLYQGCWFPSRFLPNVVAFQRLFEALDEDIILASNPKSGATWLKALLFSIVNRTRYTPSSSPLLTSNPHALIPFFEITPPNHGLSGGTVDTPRPQLFATHIPFAVLPKSVAGKSSSRCRIVYICRNPLDTIVSFWNFFKRGHPDSYGTGQWTLDECVETFCKGESAFGPFWDHVLGFWNAGKETPEKVLFLKYEDMLEDTASQVKRIAEFLGFPFSEEEESSGVVGQIMELCSLKTLKELDVNKHGKENDNLEYKVFFRKGEVGDWVNHLSPSMVESVKRVMEEKLHGSGLTFKYSL